MQELCLAVRRKLLRLCLPKERWNDTLLLQLYERMYLEESMKTSFKYGVSAIALLAAISLAQAQTSERQGGGASGSEHSMGGRGGESGRSAQGERGAQSERGAQGEHGAQGGGAEQGQNGASRQHQGKSAEQGNHSESQKGQSATEHEQGGAQKGRTAQQRGEGGSHQEQSAEHGRDQEHGQQAEHNRTENRATREGEGERAGRNTEQGERSAKTERENRDTRGEETRGRETELGGARGNEAVGRGRGESNRFASISREQRTRIHGILVRDTAIHRYHRADVDFPVQVGSRIPNTIEFYDAPAQVVQIDPVFQGYKIVVLDDVILVIDPSTREIVDVIRT